MPVKGKASKAPMLQTKLKSSQAAVVDELKFVFGFSAQPGIMRYGKVDMESYIHDNQKLQHAEAKVLEIIYENRQPTRNRTGKQKHM